MSSRNPAPILGLALFLLVLPHAAASGQASLSLPTCLGGPDTDRDGLADACEDALARGFAPELVVSDHSCNWDGGLLGGGYLFGVDWIRRGESIRIAYLPAYFADCEWSGIKCWVRLRGGCRGHPADSELIVVDLEWTETQWRIAGVFLSAHCFGDDGCRWYVGDELEAFEWTGAPRGSPAVVWVAEGKNANYPSRPACDRGHRFYDTCDRNWARYRFPVDPGKNIGSLEVPIGESGCISLEALGVGDPDSGGAMECIWSSTPFRGWGSSAGPGVTPYRRYLEEILGWAQR